MIEPVKRAWAYHEITYKEFEQLIYSIDDKLDVEDMVWSMRVKDEDGQVIATVSKIRTRIMSTDWREMEYVESTKKDGIGDTCWALACTPLEKRELENL